MSNLTAQSFSIGLCRWNPKHWFFQLFDPSLATRSSSWFSSPFSWNRLRIRASITTHVPCGLLIANPNLSMLKIFLRSTLYLVISFQPALSHRKTASTISSCILLASIRRACSVGNDLCRWMNQSTHSPPRGGYSMRSVDPLLHRRQISSATHC